MPPESAADVKFEIGHVLFIDIVGYSKLLITEQSEQIETLKQIVRGTERFRLAEAEGKLLRLPTGDGGALVFRTSPEAPVMNCGDTGHILLSKRVAVDLEQYPRWRRQPKLPADDSIPHWTLGVRRSTFSHLNDFER